MSFVIICDLNFVFLIFNDINSLKYFVGVVGGCWGSVGCFNVFVKGVLHSFQQDSEFFVFVFLLFLEITRCFTRWTDTTSFRNFLDPESQSQ